MIRIPKDSMTTTLSATWRVLPFSKRRPGTTGSLPTSTWQSC